VEIFWLCPARHELGGKEQPELRLKSVYSKPKEEVQTREEPQGPSKEMEPSITSQREAGGNAVSLGKTQNQTQTLPSTGGKFSNGFVRKSITKTPQSRFPNLEEENRRRERLEVI
jgi:hypothetical protein